MHDPAHHNATPDGPLCPHCGYLLRGVRSPVCVECGRPRCRRLTFFDPMEFDAFRAAFDLHGVPHGYLDPNVGVLGMETRRDHFSMHKVIWIKWTDLLLAEQALEDVGLSLPVALIDEHHPYCPCCGFALGFEVEDPRCEVCGTRCAWYEETDEAGGEQEP